MKCNACGNEFEPEKEKRYTAKSINFITKEESFWDCFDCPKCGCQLIVNKRMEVVEDGKEQSK